MRINPVLSHTNFPQTNAAANVQFKGSLFPFNNISKCRAEFTNMYKEILPGLEFPRDYYICTEKTIPFRNVRYSKTGRVIPAVPEHKEEIKLLKGRYFLAYLWANGKGEGTKFVQEVVKKSMKNPNSNGRVVLEAEMIDGEKSPAGFYYKLGFRFANQKYNRYLEEWNKNGGRKNNAPCITGVMYLPKENIQQCLNYKLKTCKIGISD